MKQPHFLSDKVKALLKAKTSAHLQKFTQKTIDEISVFSVLVADCESQMHDSQPLIY